MTLLSSSNHQNRPEFKWLHCSDEVVIWKRIKRHFRPIILPSQPQATAHIECFSCFSFQVVIMLVFLLTVFALCWLPFQISILYAEHRPNKSSPVSPCPFWMPSPIVWGFRNRSVKLVWVASSWWCLSGLKLCFKWIKSSSYPQHALSKKTFDLIKRFLS